MGVMIIITSLMLFCSFLLVKKAEKNENLVFWFIMSIVLFLCYNTILSWILTVVHIPINAITYSIFNLLISLLFFLLIKKEGIQKYDIKTFDVACIVVIFILGILIGVYNFKWPFEIAYETTDPNVHYISSWLFYKGDSLLVTAKDTSELYGQFNTMMPISYVNIGLVFKAAASFISENSFYKVFILFDICMLCLSGMALYASLVNFVRNTNTKIIAFVISIFYMLGYPLNNMMFGFFYLGMTVVVINALIPFVGKLSRSIDDNDKRACNFYIAIVFMLTFNIFFGYYLFMPCLYLSLGLYYLFYFWKKKQMFSRSFWKVGILTLGLPAIIGIWYFFLAPMFMGSNIGAGVSHISTEGYIYRELYSNFIFYIPFAIYYIVSSIKNKVIDFLMITIIIVLSFISILFFFGLLGKVSSYYYFKNYFVLSLLLSYITVTVANEIIEKNMSLFINSILGTYVLMFCLFITNADSFITEKNLLFNVEGRMHQYFSIYNHNKIYSQHNVRLDDNQMQIINFYKENIQEDPNVIEHIPVIGADIQRLWFYALTNAYPNKVWYEQSDNKFSHFYEESITLDEFIESDFKILISFSIEQKPELVHLIDNDFQILFENASGFILVRK